jgi:hypothetical protein
MPGTGPSDALMLIASPRSSCASERCEAGRAAIEQRCRDTVGEVEGGTIGFDGLRVDRGELCGPVLGLPAG